MARTKQEANYIGTVSHLSSGKNVSFIELPYFIGPWQFLKQQKLLNSKITQSIKNIKAVFICRVPGTIGNIAIKYLCNAKIPFGVEVVGDPWDVFAPGSMKHPLRSYFRWRGYFNLKNNVSKASAALFVTAKKLQQRYPVSANVFQTEASNVKINDTLILEKAKSHIIKKQYTLLSVGSLSQMYKAPDVVLKAVKLLKDTGVYCKLIWLGDGFYKSLMESLAKDLDVFEQVDFMGNVSAGKVREHLLVSDIFVLASRTEGLPRAIIEAMAVGLPCVGTNVGGIPELLENSALIVKNNPKALADKIKKLISESSYYNQQATRNLLEAEKYKESILKKKREDFYNYLIALNS